MNKETLVTSISDCLILIANISERILATATEGDLIAPAERDCITRLFKERLKSYTLYADYIKELMTPGCKVSKEEVLEFLRLVSEELKGHVINIKKLEKGFTRLCTKRSKRLSDTREIMQLIKANY